MIKIEYVWLDGYTPEPNLRSKIKVVDKISIWNLEEIPYWNFDGSSTKQADGSNSDCILKPVRLYYNAKSMSHIYVLCEVLGPENKPHYSNFRSLIKDDEDFWFGFEQEYFIREGKNKSILGHSSNNEQQGKFYCGVGTNVVGRQLVDEHLDYCISYGINITGINAEVALGQWEYQVFSKGSLKAGDDLWMARYFMEKMSEKYGFHIEYHPKPLGIDADWNGSGLHTNFSTKKMREVGGELYFKSLFRSLESRKDLHINVYGSNNHLRLTGNHETQSINKFSWGISDRGASIRVPRDTSKEWKGYVEDRRPASNADPYKIIKVISETILLTDELHQALNNMYGVIDMKKIENITTKFDGILTTEELLKDYINDEDYYFEDNFMESKLNIKPKNI